MEKEWLTGSATDLWLFLVFHRLSAVIFNFWLGSVRAFHFLGPHRFDFGTGGLVLDNILLPGFGQWEGFILLAFQMPLVGEEEPEEERRNADEILLQPHRVMSRL